MTEARRWLERLTLRASEDVVARSIGHAETLHFGAGSQAELRAEFDAASAALFQFGTMSGDVHKAWSALCGRIGDDGVSERLSAISEQLEIGATSGGEVCAETRAFADGSYLIMVDHGMANLTWLAASLFVLSRRTTLLGVPPAHAPLDAEIAARALRLSVARIAAGGRAGVVPSLILQPTELSLAGALVREMDVFLLAHEASHILLEHLGGSTEPRKWGHAEEISADLLAAILVFDDMFTAGEAQESLVRLRIIAIRLLFCVLDLHERDCHLTMSASHPPAGERWHTLIERRFTAMFTDLDELLEPAELLPRALAGLASDTRLADPGKVKAGLGERLDSTLWSYRDWSTSALLGRRLCTTAAEALQALLAWPDWGDGTDAAQEVGALVATALGTDQLVALAKSMRTSAHAFRRLAVAQIVSPAVEGVIAERRLEGSFPSWAVTCIVMELLGNAAARR
ncbi:hypothetical protein [Lentzea sp. NEAU-D7]|uniref:hypothetical protein n=1 Tax=Lentzea sp. NEAU-D7 TaxID=2994667 RepID=UPI00224A4C5D|nr:hypothetical protein [Lentzea sp. NEAU-D7]MCX2947045.1 hypothetical protein [Lentzea sp. NEAU-D7]